MDLNIEKKYYIGTSKGGKWSSVYAYKPHSDSVFLEKGEVFAVISLDGPKSFNASIAGSLLLDYLHESYFECKHQLPLICLEKAIIGTARKLGEIVNNDQNIGEEGIDLDISIISVVDKIAYFVNMGQGGFFLYRGGNIVNVNSALRDPSGDGYLKSASTVINKNDVLLLFTPQAIDAFTKDEVLESASEFNELVLKNKPLEDESKLSLLLVGIGMEAADAKKETIKEDEVEQRVVIKDDSQIMKKTERELEKSESDIDEDLPETKDYEDKSAITVKKKNFQEKAVANIKNFFNTTKEKVQNLELNQQLKDRWDNLKPEDSSEDNTFKYLVKKVQRFSGKWFKKIKQVVWYDFLQMDQGIYLRNARRGTNWRLIGVIIIIVVVLGVISLNTISANQERARLERNAEETITRVRENLNKIEPEINGILGIVSTYNRERSTYQGELTKAKEDLNKAKEIENFGEEADVLLSKIKNLENLLNRRIVIENPNVIYDFASSVDENVSLSDLTLTDNQLYITDENRGAVYRINYNGQDFVELVSSLEEPKTLGFNEDGELFGADNNTSEPLFSINPNNGEIKRLSGILSPDNKLNTISVITMFKFNGVNRIYFLKQGGTPIQYVSAVGAGYAGTYDRFTDPEFLNVKDIAISDGKIYLLIPGEGAVRYLGDNRENFSLYGLTSQELQNVTNSDSFEVSGNYVVYGNSRGRSIVFATKSRSDDATISDFFAQITYTGEFAYLKDIREVKIDYSAGFVFVLDGTRVLRFNLSDIEKFIY